MREFLVALIDTTPRKIIIYDSDKVVNTVNLKEDYDPDYIGVTPDGRYAVLVRMGNYYIDVWDIVENKRVYFGSYIPAEFRKVLCEKMKWGYGCRNVLTETGYDGNVGSYTLDKIPEKIQTDVFLADNGHCNKIIKRTYIPIICRKDNVYEFGRYLNEQDAIESLIDQLVLQKLIVFDNPGQRKKHAKFTSLSEMICSQVMFFFTGIYTNLIGNMILELNK